MSFKGPIIPKNNSTENTVPYVSAVDPTTITAVEGEIITNIVDGRLWLRKKINFGNIVRGTTAYNFEQIGGPYVINQKTGGYTLMAEDTGIIIEMNVSSGTTVIVPSYTGPNGVNFVKGTEIKILLTNTGPVSITGTSGVTLNSKNGFDITSRWGMASLIKRDVNSWVVTGDLS